MQSVGIIFSFDILLRNYLVQNVSFSGLRNCVFQIVSFSGIIVSFFFSQDLSFQTYSSYSFRRKDLYGSFVSFSGSIKTITSNWKQSRDPEKGKSYLGGGFIFF